MSIDSYLEHPACKRKPLVGNDLARLGASLPPQPPSCPHLCLLLFLPTDIQRLLPVPPTWGEIKGSACERRHTGTGKQEVEPGSHGYAVDWWRKVCDVHARSLACSSLPLEDKRRGLGRLKRDAITKAADVNSLICERFNDNGATGWNTMWALSKVSNQISAEDGRHGKRLTVCHREPQPHFTLQSFRHRRIWESETPQFGVLNPFIWTLDR